MDVSEVDKVVLTSLESLNAPHADAHLVASFEHALVSHAGHDTGSFFNELGRIKQQFSDAKQTLQASLSTSGDDPAALMQMQWSLMRINLQEELIAKTVGRLTQNVETLMKAQ